MTIFQMAPRPGVAPHQKGWSTLLITLAMGAIFLYSPRGLSAPAPRDGGNAADRADAKAGASGQPAGGENQIEEIEIIGKVYKPEVFVFLGRKALNLSWDLEDPRFKRSFLDAVINSVWGPPF